MSALNDPEFKTVLKEEIEQLDASVLPLQQGMSHSSYVSGDKFNVMILGVSEDADYLHVKTGIFYSGVIAGCNCADDPTPVDEQPEYCEIEFNIDKTRAEATIRLLSD